MSLQVRAARKEHFPWLVQKTQCALTTDFSAIEAIDAAGHILGMVGYCNTTKNAVQLHCAVESPLVWRSLLRPALEYPFVQAEKGICIGVIPANNTRSVAFARAVGFREVLQMKDGWSKGVPLLFLELRREDCRFLLGNEMRNERRVA